MEISVLNKIELVLEDLLNFKELNVTSTTLPWRWPKGRAASLHMHSRLSICYVRSFVCFLQLEIASFLIDKTSLVSPLTLNYFSLGSLQIPSALIYFLTVAEFYFCKTSIFRNAFLFICEVIFVVNRLASEN